jgi:hypothetical protein
VTTAISASSANIRKLEKIFILKDGINVFPNLNSGKVRKFQGFGNLLCPVAAQKVAPLIFPS